jgi:hypothetical protein
MRTAAPRGEEKKEKPRPRRKSQWGFSLFRPAYAWHDAGLLKPQRLKLRITVTSVSTGVEPT